MYVSCFRSAASRSLASLALFASAWAAGAGIAHAQPGNPLEVGFTPGAILVGQSTRLEWKVGTGSGSGTCSVTGLPSGAFSEPDLMGFRDLQPTSSLEVLVECDVNVGPEGQLFYSKSATLTVQAQPVPPTVEVSFQPPQVVRNNATTLQWSSGYATGCSSPQVPGVSGTSGSVSFSSSSTTNVTVTCTGPGGQGSGSATLAVLPAGRPQVVIFGGTGGTKLYASRTADPAAPLWVAGLPCLLNIPFGGCNKAFREHLALKLDPASNDPDAVIPAQKPVYIHRDALANDGLHATGCLTGTSGPFCIGNYLDPFAARLRAANFDVKSIPYDFRLAWSQHYPTIRQSIDEAWERGMQERVYIVAHSQGTQLWRAFIKDNPEYRSKVALAFNAGAPHLGSAVPLTFNTPRTGCSNFGLPFLNSATGCRLGAYSPAGYYQNPSTELMKIFRANIGHWVFEDYLVDAAGTHKLAPAEDTLESAHEYMRSLAASPTLFDRGVEIQQALAAHQHGVPSYQLVRFDHFQVGAWLLKSHTSSRFGHPFQMVEPRRVPSDGTIPAVSTLGCFSGGPNRGTLEITGTEHQDLLNPEVVFQFITRAIRLDRGYADAGFAGDFPLLSDQQVLDRIGWTLPAGTPCAGTSSKRRKAALPPGPANQFEFSTPDVGATITLVVKDRTAQEDRTYRVTRAGVELVESNSAVPGNLRLFETTAEPTMHATPVGLFVDGMESELGMPEHALASNLGALDVTVPLRGDDMEVSVSMDRAAPALVRVQRIGLDAFAAKVASIPALAAGATLRYARNVAVDPLGALHHQETAVPLVDDDVIP
jgi:hypothetical protein